MVNSPAMATVNCSFICINKGYGEMSLFVTTLAILYSKDADFFQKVTYTQKRMHITMYP